MGEAKNRGTYEQRVAQAKTRDVNTKPSIGINLKVIPSYAYRPKAKAQSQRDVHRVKAARRKLYLRVGQRGLTRSEIDEIICQ